MGVIGTSQHRQDKSIHMCQYKEISTVLQCSNNMSGKSTTSGPVDTTDPECQDPNPVGKTDDKENMKSPDTIIKSHCFQ